MANNGAITLVTLGEEDNLRLSDYHESYIRLQRQLHGESFACEEWYLDELRTDEKEILVFALRDGVAVGTAHATLANIRPTPKMHVENVVVDTTCRGMGVGAMMMRELELKAFYVLRHHISSSMLIMQLTNSPKKGNSGFYKSLGFSPRTLEADDPTVVWVKNLHA